MDPILTFAVNLYHIRFTYKLYVKIPPVESVKLSSLKKSQIAGNHC